MTEWGQFALSWYATSIHNHTPGSKLDYDGDKEISPDQYLQCVVDAGLNLIAITDHNTVEWIEPVLEAKLNSSDPRIKDLCILPGVEITTYDGIHVLAIFEENKDPNQIESMLYSLGLPNVIGMDEEERKKAKTNEHFSADNKIGLYAVSDPTFINSLDISSSNTEYLDNDQHGRILESTGEADYIIDLSANPLNIDNFPFLNVYIPYNTMTSGRWVVYFDTNSTSYNWLPLYEGENRYSV